MKTKRREILEISIISLIVTLLFCIPFLSGMINIGSDTCFHMNRIESLKLALENKDLYPYVFYNQNYYFGYASPCFYCIVFLYPAAILRNFFSIATSWRIYIGMIIYSSCFTVQYVFYKFKNNSKVYSKFIIAFLYVMNFLVLTRAFKRGAIGELLALIFIPLVILNIKRMLFDKENNWIGLGVSFALLLMAHNISFILMVGVFGLLILIKIKSVFKDKLFISIIKGTVLALLLCSFYLAPMLEQMKTGIYNINNYFGGSITGIEIKDIFNINMSSFGGLYEISLLIASIIIPLFLFKNKEYRWLTILGLSLLVISTNLIPWEHIPYISFIQFTNRLLIIALPFLCLASGLVIDDIRVESPLFNKIVITISILFSIFVSFRGLFVLKGMYGEINNATTSWDITDCDTQLGGHSFCNELELSTPEYLPAKEFDYYEFQNQMYTHGDNGGFGSMTKIRYNSMQHTIIPTIANEKFTYPKTYYKGYVVDILDEDGNYLETVEAILEDEAFVAAKIPEKYVGQTIITQIRYKGTIVQKISMIISLLTIGFIIFMVIRKTRKLSKEQVT